MGKINLGRAVLGGLLAGLVINLGEFVLNALILSSQWEDAMKELNKPPIADSAIPFFVAGGFVLGVLAVWTYAAIRPRFGAGPKTAVCAGLIAWALGYLCPTIGMAGIGIFPTNLLMIGLVWGLVEVPLATVVGAWPYQEAA